MFRFSQEKIENYYGRVITGAKVSDNKLHLVFENGAKVAVFDNASYCCENRYMSTDDSVGDLVGHRLVQIEEKEGPSTGNDYGNSHDICFVQVQTDRSFITLVNHNEHNGYYGGFELALMKED